MKKTLLVLAVALSTLFLAGCESEQEAMFDTKQSFENPELIGTLPDGREVKRVVVYLADAHDQYVYFVDGGGVTVNREVSQGKMTRNMVTFNAPPIEDTIRAEAEAKLAQAQKLEAEAKQMLAQ